MMVVTGVHRSGTSAIAMTLRALGVDFGPEDNFYAADRWNERGYVERVDVIDLNTRLVTGLPRTRGRVSSLAAQVHYVLLPYSRGIERRSYRLAGEIRQLAEGLNGIAVKDPRFCVTLCAWREFVTQWVVCLRHPLAVAESLQRRQRVPLPLALRFWNRHAEGLLETPRERSLFVDFDALSGPDGAEELCSLVDFLELDVTVDGAVATLREQFSPELRHFAGGGASELPERTRALWNALQMRRAGYGR